MNLGIFLMENRSSLCDSKAQRQITSGARACNPRIQEVTVRGSGVRGHPQLHREFKASLAIKDPVSKQNKRQTNRQKTKNKQKRLQTVNDHQEPAPYSFWA